MKKFLSIVLVCIFTSSFTYADLVVVVHQSSPLTAITASDLKKIYANKLGKWEHGGAIVRTVLKKGSTYKSFCKKIKKSSSKLKRFWKKQVFTGKGPALKVFSSENKLLEFVETKEGAIGFVDSSSDTSKVKVLQFIK